MGLCLWVHMLAFADDPGIHKTRITQVNDSTYIIEVDVTAQWLWAITSPIFPQRFKVSELSYAEKGTLNVVRAVAVSSDGPLNSKDEILFPWRRNGADITVKWLDGSVSKGLFIRSFEGIIVPIKKLKTQEIEKSVLIQQQIKYGLHAWLFLGVISILILTVFLLYDRKTALNIIGLFALAQLFAILFEAWFSFTIPMLFSYVLMLLLVIVLLLSEKNKFPKQFYPIVAFLGFLNSISYTTELNMFGLGSDTNSLAILSYLIGLIVPTLLLGSLIYLTAEKVKKSNFLFNRILGGLSIALLLFMFFDKVSQGDTQVINFDEAYQVTENTILVDPIQGLTTKNQGKESLTTPMISYLSISPYEVRHEVLLNARVALELIGVNTLGKGSIPIESQAQVKEYITSLFNATCKTAFNSQSKVADITNVNFVSLSSAGVMPRNQPQVEVLDDGILGITMIYGTNQLIDSLQVDWSFFLEKIPEIEVNTIDLFSAETRLVDETSKRYHWQNSLPGYQPADINNIEVSENKLPYISYLLMAIILVILVLSYVTKKSLKKIYIALLVIALVSIPFGRFQVNLPGFSHLKPSKENSAQILKALLTNVYYAFDVRNEEMIYDRLSRTVTGDKLTDIYLENRKSLEFENRGGARASVDDVDIEELHTVTRGENGSFVAEVEWLIGGSVNHFGHTHYRRNYYHALITFTIIEGNWKIVDIEVIDNKRLL